MFDLQDYIVVFLIWLITIIFLRAIFTTRRGKLRLPPSPPALPILGHMHLLVPILHQSLAKLSSRHGPLLSFYIGSKPCLLVSSRELAKEALKTNETSFLNRPILANLDYLTYGTADMAMAPYTPHWKFMRKLCMAELLGTRALNRFLPVRLEELKQFLKLVQEKAKAEEAVDIGEELRRLTSSIISRMLLSTDKEEADEMLIVMTEMNGLVTKVNLSDYFWFCKRLGLLGYRKRLKDVRDRYDILMDKIMLKHKEARKKNGAEGDTMEDALDVLMDISEDENADMKLTRENIKAIVTNILEGGINAFSLTIAWSLAELINHPEEMKKAQKEIDSVVGKSRIVEESDIQNLPYLQAIIKETLRLHPAGPLVVRDSTEDCTIGGYEIPEGTTLFVNSWALGKDPKQWDKPLEFIPERFLSDERRKNQFWDVRGQNFSLLPFGTGRRSCPGASLALHVVPTVLGMLIQCFDWKVDGETDKINMEERAGISLFRAHPIICRPVARLSPFPSV